MNSMNFQYKFCFNELHIQIQISMNSFKVNSPNVPYDSPILCTICKLIEGFTDTGIPIIDFDALSIFCNHLDNFMSKPCIKLNGDGEHTGSLKKWAQTSIGAHWIIYWMEYNWNSLDCECREYSEDQGPRNTAPGSGNIVSKVDFKRRHLSNYLPRNSNSSQSKSCSARP